MATIQSLHPPRGGTTPIALERHLRDCARARGRWFGVGCLAERIHAFVAPRFVTTVFVATGLLALAAVWT